MSVLFVDLVGFTEATERRDAEDTRDALDRYFVLTRSVIERHGGRVEKFIGDAVMALWGAPVAHEDDPGRAVLAALEVIAAVPALGSDASPLQARAGVTITICLTKDGRTSSITLAASSNESIRSTINTGHGKVACRLRIISTSRYVRIFLSPKNSGLRAKHPSKSDNHTDWRAKARTKSAPLKGCLDNPICLSK